MMQRRDAIDWTIQFTFYKIEQHPVPNIEQHIEFAIPVQEVIQNSPKDSIRPFGQKYEKWNYRVPLPSKLFSGGVWNCPSDLLKVIYVRWVCHGRQMYSKLSTRRPLVFSSELIWCTLSGRERRVRKSTTTDAWLINWFECRKPLRNVIMILCTERCRVLQWRVNVKQQTHFTELIRSKINQYYVYSQQTQQSHKVSKFASHTRGMAFIADRL